MNRSEILDTAKSIVTKDRNATHGNPEDSFALIAKYWSAHLGVSISSPDVAMMMALLKIARIQGNRATGDCFVALAGYVACGGELENL